MRVLAVSQTYFPYLREGGRPTKVRAIAGGLVQRGHDVTVLTSHLGPFQQPDTTVPFDLRPGAFGFEAKDGGVDVVYLRSLFRRRSVTINPGLVRFCRMTIENVDVAHLYGIYDFFGPVVASFCRRHGVPYVVETMGMFRPFSRTVLGKRAYHHLIGRKLIAGAQRIVATSEREKAELLDGGVPAEKVVVRPNGVERPIGTRPRDFRARFGIPEDTRVILFLSRIVPLKSPDMLLRAFARMLAELSRIRLQEHWQLVIAGPIEEPGYHRELVKLSESLGIRSSVTFAPALYDAHKWSAYAAASVFVLPSTSENFGNSAAEAIAAGTPVIVTDRCGIASVVEAASNHPPCGLVIPHDEGQLAEALIRVARDQDWQRQLVVGCETVAQKLGWEAPLSQLEALYQEVGAH